MHACIVTICNIMMHIDYMMYKINYTCTHKHTRQNNSQLYCSHYTQKDNIDYTTQSTQMLFIIKDINCFCSRKSVNAKCTIIAASDVTSDKRHFTVQCLHNVVTMIVQ